MTKDGTDPLLSKEENVMELLEPPTQIEMNHAITNNIGGLLIVVRLPLCSLLNSTTNPFPDESGQQVQKPVMQEAP